MHVLILPSWYPANRDDVAGSFFREQSLALKKYGHQVGVIYPELHPWSTRKTQSSNVKGMHLELDDGLATLRAYGTKWPTSIPYLNTLSQIHWWWRLYNRYTKEFGRPDLIHVHSMLNAGLLAQLIKMRHGIPFVVTEHSSAYARGELRAIKLFVARSIARSAARCFAVSQHFCSLLEDLLGASGGSWIEMPNMVEQRFLNHPLATQFLKGGQFKFVNVALLNKNKGVHSLIRAFGKAFKGDLTVILNIGGDGVERTGLEALAKELGIADQVRFLGALNRDQVVEVMAGSSVFVLSSRYETFGVVVVEALALGKPVIATRCGGPESIVREQDGLLVQPDDVDALAGAMQQLRARYRSYRAEEIRAACISRYSEKVVVERLTMAYREVLNSRVGVAH